MSIGASEHRTFVRAKARFAGQKAQEHILSVEMLLHRTYCHVSLVAFSGGKCRVCLALPEVPASDLPVLIHSRRNASCQALCDIRPHALQGLLRLPPLPGVSRFRLLTGRRPRNFAWQMVAGSDRGRDGALAQRLRARGHAPATPTTRP